VYTFLGCLVSPVDGDIRGVIGGRARTGAAVGQVAMLEIISVADAWVDSLVHASSVRDGFSAARVARARCPEVAGWLLSCLDKGVVNPRDVTTG
jgi:hypothetical protein